MDNKVQILLVNTGSTPISYEKHEFAVTEAKRMQQFILDSLNRLGKVAHALVKFNGEYWVCDHTARKGPSKEYFKHKVRYHPYMKELS